MLVLAVVGAMLLAACGGDDDDSTATKSTASSESTTAKTSRRRWCRARRHRGLDQGRRVARRLRVHQGLRRRRPPRPGQDLRRVLQGHQRLRRHQRPQDRAGLQDLLPDPGRATELARDLHLRGRGRQRVRGHGRVRRLHRGRPALRDARPAPGADHPRPDATLDRRGPTRAAAQSGHHGRAPPERDHVAVGQRGHAEGQDRCRARGRRQQGPHQVDGGTRARRS